MISSFESTPTDENKSLEFKQKLLNSINVEFNYYPINCQEIQRTTNTIQAVYRGNRPNIVLNNNDYFPKYYQTTEFILYGNKLHNGSHDAELLIKHTSITSDIIPIYVCFFLHRQKGGPINSPPNIIDTIIQSANISGNRTILDEIDMSELLKPYFIENENYKIPITWKMYETIEIERNKCFVILIEKPIIFNSSFDFVQDNNNENLHVKYPFMIKNVNHTTSLQTNQEGFVIVDGKDKESSGVSTKGYALDANGNEMICEIVNDETSPNIDLYQIPLSSTSYQNQQNLNILMTIIYCVIAIVLFFILFFGGAFLYDYITSRNFITKSQFIFVYVIVFIALIVGCLSYGINYNNTVITMIGVLMCACFIVISAGIKIIPKFMTNSSEKES
jgi:hypothetical protein